MNSKYDQAKLHADTIAAALRASPVRVPGRPAAVTAGPWKPQDGGGVIDGTTIRPQGDSPKSGKAAVGNVVGHRDRRADKPGPSEPGEAHATRDPLKFENDQAMAAAFKGEACG